METDVLLRRDFTQLPFLKMAQIGIGRKPANTTLPLQPAFRVLTCWSGKMGKQQRNVYSERAINSRTTWRSGASINTSSLYSDSIKTVAAKVERANLQEYLKRAKTAGPQIKTVYHGFSSFIQRITFRLPLWSDVAHSVFSMETDRGSISGPRIYGWGVESSEAVGFPGSGA